ncbi:conserved hypothetical protein [Pediculus humanus corporis]|uniref:Transmembrane protein n=1 Tax=Pediculus humanus subsp. corporis TaxID=121224 RepID=E0VC50_PEDHC|nr:uncharacterized protein Phum_PHUM079910 [Pediculus humanus corporis]EEB10956.1 conserved hypothetical protein [Pediculus humanus corporis]
MGSSSLGFEILLYLNSYYFCIFIIAEICIGIFKIINLPYPTGVLMSESLIMIFLSCTETIRIFMGHKGNLTEQSLGVLISILLTIPSVLGILYFLLWQTYVLRIESILCGIQLSLQGIEFCFAIICLLRFCKAGVY